MCTKNRTPILHVTVDYFKGEDREVVLKYDEEQPIHIDDPRLISLMLEYLYSLDYFHPDDYIPFSCDTKGPNTATPIYTNAITYIQIYIIADYYSISGLQILALYKFRDTA